VHDSWRPHPLVWIHRSEARAVAAELRRFGHDVRLRRFDPSSVGDDSAGPRILRLSDPVMLRAAKAFADAGARYVGPSLAAMTRCYDKYTASGLVAASGLRCPDTALGSEADRIAFPAVLKPRWGSDSIGVRRYTRGPVPPRARSARYIVQRYVRGSEITVAVLNGQAGAPLHIHVPDGALYTFFRKYVLRPRITPVSDRSLAHRIRREALRIAAVLGVDWAARIDFIHERQSDTLYFLECDVAPLIGQGSAFEKSLSGANVTRTAQLARLLQGSAAPNLSR
jgi:D-alanine-D-alanine ligase-like ATP-grasp enzyme